MPRINIEDKLFRDERFQHLLIDLQDRELAMGVLVNLWQIAQRYWVPGERLIPKSIFKKTRCSELLKKHGFAIEKKRGVYIAGARDHFRWLAIKHDLAAKGRESIRKKSLILDSDYTPPSPSPTLINNTQKKLMNRDQYLNIKKNLIADQLEIIKKRANHTPLTGGLSPEKTTRGENDQA